MIAALRARVAAVIAALTSTGEHAETTAWRREREAANREREFWSKNWREVSESQRFLDAAERAAGEHSFLDLGRFF